MSNPFANWAIFTITRLIIPLSSNTNHKTVRLNATIRLISTRSPDEVVNRVEGGGPVPLTLAAPICA